VGITDQAVELRAMRQTWECRAQMGDSIANKGTFTGKLLPLGQQRQGDDFTVSQMRVLTRSRWLGWQRFDRIIHQHVQRDPKGVEIQPGCVPVFCRMWHINAGILQAPFGFVLLG
jgi:hypothetical protein